MIKVKDLKRDFHMFGNKGAFWSNEAHITQSGMFSTTLCGVPMLSRNWCNIEKVKEIGCKECIERYNKLVT